jgi:hypothetical protein
MEEARFDKDNRQFVSTPLIRTLRRAVEALGSEERLAEVLGVARSVITNWLSGETRIPDPVYLKALDLVAHPVNPRYWT